MSDPDPDDPRHLFTYGTLQPGSPVPAARSLAQVAAAHEPATTTGTLYRGGGWPAWHPKGDGPVFGTLWTLPDDAAARDALLASLDVYEGVERHAPQRSLFVRDVTSARRADGADVRTWIYRYARPVRDLEWIAEGRWPVDLF